MTIKGQANPNPADEINTFGQWVKHQRKALGLTQANLAQRVACSKSTINKIEGDIRDLATCRKACVGISYILHEAALGSVPRSIEDPIASNASNVTGFLNMLVAARDAGVKRFVYAASSSTYGDHPGLPKFEDTIGKPLSPYAVTKYVNELYADVFARTYGMETIGLRYFNVFGPRQDPEGAYAAVIPCWIRALIKGETVHINGSPTRACVTQISSVAGKTVTTIEGLSADTTHPVQRAWIEEDVPQCGYCQSGQIMAAASLLAKTAKLTDADISEALKGNICRCGTYSQIRRAVHRAAEMKASEVKA